MKTTVSVPCVRRAEEGDREGIEAVARAAYSIYLARMDAVPFPMLDDYAEHIGHGRAYVLAAAGDVHGYVILVDEEDALLMDNIAVHPSRQGAGYGQRLALFAEDEARRRGHGRIRLYTNEVMAENLAWYARLGYSVTHRAEEKGYRRVYMAKELAIVQSRQQ